MVIVNDFILTYVYEENPEFWNHPTNIIIIQKTLNSNTLTTYAL
jgi:hypothetical protein